MYMTDVCCNKKQCLNNRKGWCSANAICIDGQCKSYAPPNTLMSPRVGKCHKERGKYKSNNSIVLK